MNNDLTGKGPFVKVNGKAVDVGLFDHVFDGTDDAHDELLKKQRLVKFLQSEMKRRGIVKENFTETMKSLTEKL